MKSHPSMSFVVLTDDRHEPLARTLKSIRAALDRKTPLEVETLVLDLGNDVLKTQKFMKASGLTNLHWVACEQWWNRARCYNHAAKLASHDFLFFISDDCVIPENLFELLGPCRTNEIVGFVQVTKDDLIIAAGIDLTLGVAPSFRAHMLPYSRYDVRVAAEPVPAVPFYAAIVSQRVFKSVGGFDVDQQAGLEDVDFCLTANEKGHHVLLRNDVRCVCDGDSTNDMVPRVSRRMMGGVLPFARKWLIKPDQELKDRAGKVVEAVRGRHAERLKKRA